MIKYLPRHLRLIILLIGISILGIDALAQYHDSFNIASSRLPVEVSPSPLVAVTPTPQASPSLSLTSNGISQVTGFDLVKTADADRIEKAQLSFTQTTQPTVAPEVRIYTLAYEIPSRDGSWQPTTATVYVPFDPANPNQEYPLYVFGSGTTGMADKCAPSLEKISVDNLGNYENHMIAQASAGFVSVFPDYEGFHNPTRTQAYFVVESEAKVLLGAIAGLYQLETETPNLKGINFSDVFVGGYSQGGHAALSAAQSWSRLPADIQLKGIVQYAGAADVLALFNESPWLASYLTASYAAYYSPALKEGEVLQEKWVAEMTRNNASLCVNQAYKFYPHDPNAIYTTVFIDAIKSSIWPETLKGWQEAIMTNIPMSNLPKVPHLSIQGATDPIVTATAQRNNVKHLCNDGHQVLYRELPGVNHFQVRQQSLPESTQWMKAVMAGTATESSCGQL